MGHLSRDFLPVLYPRLLHATTASLSSQLSVQMVDHPYKLLYISTTPLKLSVDPISLTSFGEGSIEK